MSAQLRANEILKRFQDLKSIKGAEIGVAIGQLSEALLRDPRMHLLMVDSWAPEAEQPEPYCQSGDWHAHLSQGEQDAHYRAALAVTEFAGTRRIVIRKPSAEAAKEVENHSLDFVFIDGDHSYEGVMTDIKAWLPKIRLGGVLSGHDYGHFESNAGWATGPKRAVDEMVAKRKWTLQLGENFTWFVPVQTISGGK